VRFSICRILQIWTGGDRPGFPACQRGIYHPK
jgi:hypothetical protein